MANKPKEQTFKSLTALGRAWGEKAKRTSAEARRIRKAITLHQPHAWAIAHAGKDIENRIWKPPASVVGCRIAIHAGKVLDRDGLASLVQRGIGPAHGNELVRGAIVAVCTLAGYVKESDSPWFSGPIGWVLFDITAIDPVPCRGFQGLWNLPPDIKKLINARMP